MRKGYRGLVDALTTLRAMHLAITDMDAGPGYVESREMAVVADAYSL